MAVPGGVAALSGFIYQAVIAAGLKVMCMAKDTWEEDINGFIFGTEGTAPSSIFFEKEDADVAAIHQDSETGEDVARLIQVKYSTNPKNDPVQGPEAKTIAASMTTQRNSLERQGWAVKEKWLWTNRHLEPAAKEVLDAAEIGFKEIQTDIWSPALKRFAEKYGRFDAEIEKGITLLAGNILVGAGQEWAGVSVSESDVLLHLCNGEHARPLRASSVFERVTRDEEAEQWKGLEEADFKTVERDFLQSLPKTAPVVIFKGEGGLGKSAAALQWSRSLRCEDSRGSGCSFVTRQAGQYQTTAIRDTICEWNPASPTGEASDHLLRRLQIANPDVATVIHLTLDGGDDVAVRPDLLSVTAALVDEALKLASKVKLGPPPLRLVITCRDPEDILDLCNNQMTTFGVSEDDRVKQISFTPFTNRELAWLFKTNLPELHDRVFGERETSRVKHSSVGSLLEFAATNRPAESAILEMLRWPVAWGAFQLLAEKEALVDGLAAARLALGGIIVDRFVSKAVRRLRHHGFNRQNITEGLFAVAQAEAEMNHEGDKFIANEVWRSVSESKSLSAPSHPMFINEAISGGLIAREGSGQWRWHIRPIREFLLSK